MRVVRRCEVNVPISIMHMQPMKHFYAILYRIPNT